MQIAHFKLLKCIHQFGAAYYTSPAAFSKLVHNRKTHGIQPQVPAYFSIMTASSLLKILIYTVSVDSVFVLQKKKSVVRMCW